nr:anoctamin-5-like isoform X2 [Procambarus clarkii]
MPGLSESDSVFADEFSMDDLNFEMKTKVGAKDDLLLSDGSRTIDYVLANKHDDMNQDHSDRRKVFESNLKKEGLILESDQVEDVPFRFVKVHAPYDVCARYAELLHLSLPMKQGVCVGAPNSSTIKNKVLKYVEPDVSVSVPTTKTCTAIFSLNKKYL